MTKDWIDIKDETCALYRSGLSLEQVRDRISKTRNFRASTRSFRSKIAEWGVKRHPHHLSGGHRRPTLPVSRPQRLRSFPADQTATLCTRCKQIATRDGANKLLALRNELPRDPSTSSVMSISDDEEEHLDGGDARADNNEGCAIPLDGPDDTDALHEWYQLLAGLYSFREAEKYLHQQARFTPGEQTILHYAAREESSVALGHVIKYMQLRSLDLDIPDPENRTPLELATRSNRRGNVASLLEADPALALVTARGDHLLQIAINTTASPSIVQILLEHGASPHCEDSEGHTAMELAIQGNNAAALEVLLKSRAISSISRVRRKRVFQLALNSKICPKICIALLGALNNAACSFQCDEEPDGVMELDILIESLRSCSNEQDKLLLYSLLDQVLKRCTKLDPHDEADRAKFRIYLDSLRGLRPCDNPATLAAEHCLKAFLIKGFSPFERYDLSGPGSVPDACSFLLTYSLVHASSFEAMGQTVEYCDLVNFGQELFYLLINACKHDFWPSDAPPVTTYLLALLNRGVQFDSNKNPLSLVLQDLPNVKSTQKTRIVQLLMDWGRCKPTRSSLALGHPLDQLTKVPDPLRLDLAEVMLMEDEGLDMKSRDAFDEVADCVFTYHPIRQFWFYLNPSYETHLSKYTQSTHALKRCVVHVLTKCLMENKLHLPSVQHLRNLKEAHWVRGQMKLPDIPISLSSATLVGLLTSSDTATRMDDDRGYDHGASILRRINSYTISTRLANSLSL